MSIDTNLRTIQDCIRAVEELEGSFFHELINTMISGQFEEPSTDILTGETKIGEMNDLERALWTIAENARGSELSALRRKKACKDENGKKEIEKDRKNEEELAVIATTLFWKNLYRRFRTDKKLAIRKGFHIVVMKP